MGMHTELYLRSGLKDGTPQEVIVLLRAMVMGDGEPPETTPFGGGRCPWMLRFASHYHFPYAQSSMDYADYVNRWYLFVRCDLKNYEGEIEAFLKWLAPHLNACEGDYIGHTRYEEDPLPTHLIYGEGLLKIEKETA
jgi:hypothetical protein